MSSGELNPSAARRAAERAPRTTRWQWIAALTALAAIAFVVRARRDRSGVLQDAAEPRPESATTTATPPIPAADPPPAASGPDDDVPPASRAHRVGVPVIVGALVAVTVAAGGLLVAAIARDDAPPAPAAPPAWSSWKPVSGGRSSIPRQIAAHVAPRYRLDGGAQAVRAHGGPLRLANAPLTVAIRTPDGAGLRLIENQTSILYRLCGLGDHCAIRPGRPTTERHLLLRRQALELALYSFHYTRADQVVVFMPPRKGQSQSRGGQALLFERRGLGPRLRLPIDATLTDDVPRPADIVHSSDRLLVEQQTIPALYSFAFRETPKATRAFLLLIPMYVPGPQPRRSPGAPSAGQPV
jgi:hypothetical protein